MTKDISGPALQLLREYRRARSDTGRARVLGRAVLELATLEEVAQLAAAIRRSAGVQDVTMIEDGPYLVERRVGQEWATVDRDLDAQQVVELATCATEVQVLFPSIFQYGTAVLFTRGRARYRASTRGFGPSETYLST